MSVKNSPAWKDKAAQVWTIYVKPRLRATIAATNDCAAKDNVTTNVLGLATALGKMALQSQSQAQ